MRRREFIGLAGGAAIAWATHGRAQQDVRVRRIGFLSGVADTDPEIQSWAKAFVQGLEELGWVNGRNLRIDTRFGDADAGAARLSTLAAELIELGPDVILAVGAPAAAALRQQTLSLPIVFAAVADPVAAGFVTNLSRPEGNITGFTNFEFSVGGKWLQFLKECAPSTERIAVLFQPANATWAPYLRTIEAAAPSFRLRLIPAGVRDAVEITQRIAAFARDPNGAVVVSKPRYSSTSPVHYWRDSNATSACNVSISLLHCRWRFYVLWGTTGRPLQGRGVIRRPNNKGCEGG